MTRNDASRVDPALAVDKGAEPQAERLTSRSIPDPALTPTGAPRPEEARAAARCVKCGFPKVNPRHSGTSATRHDFASPSSATPTTAELIEAVRASMDPDDKTALTALGEMATRFAAASPPSPALAPTTRQCPARIAGLDPQHRLTWWACLLNEHDADTAHKWPDDCNVMPSLLTAPDFHPPEGICLISGPSSAMLSDLKERAERVAQIDPSCTVAVNAAVLIALLDR